MHLLNLLLTVGLIVFLIYIPFFLASLMNSIKLWGNYNLESRWVSELGITAKASSGIFNDRVSVFGLLSIFSSFALFNVLPKTNISIAFVVFLIIVGISTFCVGLFPMNTKPTAHLIASGCAFGSVLISSFISMYIIITTGALPVPFILVNIATVLVVPIYALSAHYNLNHIRKNKFQRSVVKHKGLWEWIALLLSVLWNFSMCIFLLAVA